MCEFCKKKEKKRLYRNVTYTILCEQKKYIFLEKVDEIMNPKLVLKLPNKFIIINFLKLHFKIVVQVPFKKNEKFLDFGLFWYFFGLFVEIFDFPLVDHMYKLMC